MTSSVTSPVKSSVTSFVRRGMLLSAAVAILPLAHAQSAWPTKPVTLVHPYAAGGLPTPWPAPWGSSFQSA
ncbi:hypothetical protein [Ottowia caeni]|uniref:hypothetical protein n=1 Tax=Ottowia caeni TaxID=2870339 RepID=UPI003D719FA2